MAQKTIRAEAKASPFSRLSDTAAIVVAVLITVGVELLVALVISQFLTMLS